MTAVQKGVRHDDTGLHLTPNKAKAKHATTEGWWYEEKHGIDVLGEVKCQCGLVQTTHVRILWHQLASYIRRRLGRIVL